MDKDTNQENPSLLSVKQESPRKLAHINNSSSGIHDRLKRDEWSEGAVSTLLEAYESKWILRNRAKLKGHDWEDVARHVSSRSKSPKTQTQCKNKIESMKKRYRSESAAADASSWPIYPRLDLLLRGPAATTTPPRIGPMDCEESGFKGKRNNRRRKGLAELEFVLSYSSIMFSKSSSVVTETRESKSSLGSWYLSVNGLPFRRVFARRDEREVREVRRSTTLLRDKEIEQS